MEREAIQIIYNVEKLGMLHSHLVPSRDGLGKLETLSLALEGESIPAMEPE